MRPVYSLYFYAILVYLILLSLFVYSLGSHSVSTDVSDTINQVNDEFGCMNRFVNFVRCVQFCDEVWYKHSGTI